MEKRDREVLMSGLTEIDRVVSEVGASPRVKQKTTEFYRKAAMETDVFSNRGMKKTVAACVVLGSREVGELVEASEVSEHTADFVPEKTIHATVKELKREMDMGLMLTDPGLYIDELQQALDVPDTLVEKVNENISVISGHTVSSGKTAAAIAAGVFYYTSKYGSGAQDWGKYTQSDISNTIPASEVTIRNCYRDFGDVLNQHNNKKKQEPESSSNEVADA